MQTYLSIDVDFWDKPEHLRADLGFLLSKAQVPTVAVMNHQQMLSYVNESKARRLVNVDLHSDLTDTDVDALECGTWVSYVRWRKQGSYLWVRSGTLFDGACNAADPWNKGTDWASAKTVRKSNRGYSPVGYLRGCVGLGICLSPSFSRDPVLAAARELIQKFKVPYVKGRRNEYYKRKLRVPGVG